MFAFNKLFFIFVVSHCFCDWKFNMKDSTKLMINYTLVSTKLIEEKYLNQLEESLKYGVYFDIEISELHYTVFIKCKTPSVITPETEFLILENFTLPKYKHFEYELVEGFVVEEKYTSYVLGYVEDIYFYGKIQLLDSIYYIENVVNYPDVLLKYNYTKNGISFKNPNIFNEDMYFSPWDFKEDYNFSSLKIFKRMALKGNICSLLVLIDDSFVKIIHSGKIKAAIKQVLLSIDEANSLFRSTDFDQDGYPDNIGFIIKYLILLKSSTNSFWIPKYNSKPIDGRYYMNRFSRFYLLEDVCLGVAFTGQSFLNDIVGISYAAVSEDKLSKFPYGGICDKPILNPFGLPLNTLAVSAKSTDGRIVPEYIFELSLCHEFGHSFGANHDFGKCNGYLMTDHAPRDQHRRHFTFSTCSTSSMLRTILDKGHCFENNYTAYCGNGLIELGEECDCGTIKDCLAFDKCCIPRGRQNSCQIKRELGQQCHPMQGLCCTDNCTYKNLTAHDLDCTDFQKGCPCNFTSPCKCGVKGFCTSNICSSEECTRIGAEECSCPKLNNQGCVSCCKLKEQNSSCLPASELTKLMIEKDVLSFIKLNLIDEDKKNLDHGFYKSFCNDNNCVRLFFRRAYKKDYCLLFGKVGICSNDNECLIPTPKPYKMILKEHTYHKRENSSKTIKISNWIRIIICLLTLF